jgi:hypothetical protein
MEDVNISKFRAQVVRSGSTPASPGFVVSEGQNPVDPSGSGQNHLPVTIATASTGLSITESQVLGGAGTVGQYIRGDGSLADFPATTGGGSSVSYYLNGSVSQGTIGGVAYKELNRTPIFGAGTDITINADGYIASFITDALDPNKLLIPAGNWNLETYFSASSNGGSPSFYVELYKYNGTTFTLIATSSSAPELIAFGTNLNPYFSTLAVPETVLALTDRLALRYYVTHSGRTITLHTENNHLCQVITTFTTGLTALNGLTNQVQFFAVGTSGTDFAISSASDTHTFNLPTASATNRGALSSADWTTFNGKTSNLGTVTSVGLSSATSGVTIGSTPVTTSGTITLAIATASGSQNGLLSSTDWTTFNGKQNALTNPVTGTGASGQVAYFTGTSAISSESNLFWDATNDRLGIGLNNPAYNLDIVGTQKIGGVALPFLDFKTNATTGAGFQFKQISYSDATNAELWNIGFNYPYLQFLVGGTRVTSFTPNGNVLIGTTTDAGFKLDVNGTGRYNQNNTSVGNATGIRLEQAGSGDVAISYLLTGVREWLMGVDNSDSDSFKISNITGSGDFNSTGLCITIGGDVGINVTPTSGNRFWVKGSSTSSGDSTILAQNSAGTNLFYVLNNGNVVMPNGNVLIGTTTDGGQKFQVSGTGRVSGLLTAQDGIYQTNASNVIASNKFSTFNGGATDLNFEYPASGSVTFTNGTPRFTLASSGAATFSSLGTGSVTATAGLLSTVSDLSYKIDDGFINSAIEKVLSLKPRYFYWNEKSGLPMDIRQLGFYAQEVNEALGEEAANTPKDKNTAWGISDRSIIAMLTKAIQELKEEIDTLKN